MRCGEPIWQTRSTWPMSMPSSSEAVATSALSCAGLQARFGVEPLLLREAAVMQELKAGRLKALVATASLELGIDIGHINLVCRMGSPGAGIATLLAHRSIGRALGGRGRMLRLWHDDLMEMLALLRAVRRTLDCIVCHDQPLCLSRTGSVHQTSCASTRKRALRACWRASAVPYTCARRSYSTRQSPWSPTGLRPDATSRTLSTAQNKVNHHLQPRRLLSALTSAARPKLPSSRRSPNPTTPSSVTAERRTPHREHGGRHLSARQRVIALCASADTVRSACGRRARRRRFIFWLGEAPARRRRCASAHSASCARISSPARRRAGSSPGRRHPRWRVSTLSTTRLPSEPRPRCTSSWCDRREVNRNRDSR